MPAKKKQDDQEADNASEQTNEKVETVSAKRVIYTEIDDEVTSVYDKIKATKGNNIYIVVPKRAILFQSVVNLKILKRKAEDDNKKIYLITNDKNGIHLAQKTGIEVYDKSNSEGKSGLFSSEPDDDRLKITPLKASVNATYEETPTRTTERKLSIGEILHNSKGKRAIDISKIRTAEKKPEVVKSRSKFVIVAPNRHALIGLIAVSLIILLVIVYVALPGVTVYLTPTATVLEKSVNITLADSQKNRAELETNPSHTVAAYPISTKVSKAISQYATGKKFSEKGANASGKITIINTTNNAWPLIPKTRFQTKDGLVFRIAGSITVPAATAQGSGKVEAFVIADQVDAYEGIIGERGNIGPSSFFLPGLKADSQSKLYGESYEQMKGGVTDYLTYVTAEDIETSKIRLKDELIKSALSDLKVAVQQKAELVGQGTNYTLLEGDNQALKVSEPKITIDQSLVGKELMEFKVSGEVDVSGVYYDHDAMLEILKNELLLKKSPQKELVRINEGSTTYRIFQWDEDTGKIKITANIKGIEQFEIDPDKENGLRLLEKIREHIAGLDIEEAKIYIQNLPEINKVEIESWPAWSPTVPSLTDNIDFEIRDAVQAE